MEVIAKLKRVSLFGPPCTISLDNEIH